MSRLFNWVTYVMPYLSGGTGGGLPSTTTVDYVVGVGHDPYAIIDSDPGIQRLFLDDYGGPGQAARAPASNGESARRWGGRGRVGAWADKRCHAHRRCLWSALDGRPDQDKVVGRCAFAPCCAAPHSPRLALLCSRLDCPIASACTTTPTIDKTPRRRRAHRPPPRRHLSAERRPPFCPPSALMGGKRPWERLLTKGRGKWLPSLACPFEPPCPSLRSWSRPSPLPPSSLTPQWLAHSSASATLTWRTIDSAFLVTQRKASISPGLAHLPAILRAPHAHAAQTGSGGCPRPTSDPSRAGEKCRDRCQGRPWLTLRAFLSAATLAGPKYMPLS